MTTENAVPQPNWSQHFVAENVLLQAMRHLFRSNPNLLSFTFDTNEPQLRRSAGALLQEARGLSGGENLLVRIALDLWNQSGAVSLSEVVERLDSPAFDNVIAALKLLGPKRHSIHGPQAKSGRKADPGWNDVLF